VRGIALVDTSGPDFYTRDADPDGRDARRRKPRMADDAEYADRLRETLLALTIIPIAAFDTATYWLKESLDRSSRLGADLVLSTTLARFTQAAEVGDNPDPVAEVLAADVLEAARLYVRSMVRLPADAGVYFTGELERRLSGLLERIQPEATKDLEAHVDLELQRVLQELDRLFVVVRTETRRRRRREAERYEGAEAKPPVSALESRIDELRKRVRDARPEKGAQTRARLSVDAPLDDRVEGFTRARAQTRARARLHEALREATALIPQETPALERLHALVEKLLPSRPLSSPLAPEGDR